MSERELFPAALERYIATRDKRQKSPVTNMPLRELFLQLLERGRVEVGGRASCGGAPDATWILFTAWTDVVQKANSLGISISITPVKHGNAWATKARGFWQSNIYELCTVKATEVAA